MIRTPLTFHTPEAIYSHLEKEIGPLRMLVKKGQALITFDRMEDNPLALEKCKCIILQGQPLRLFEYKDGDLERKPQPMSIQPPVPTAPIEPPPKAPAMSQTCKMVEQAIEIKDSADSLQAITKTHFKEVIECVAKFKPIYVTAKNREKEFLAQPSAESEKMVKDLQRFTQNQLNEIKGSVMGLYKKTRNHISKFGLEKERCEIDLDPSLRPVQTESKPMHAGQLESTVLFINQQPNLQVKKLAALNDSQFVCTNTIVDKVKGNKGRVKVYNLQEEYEIMGTVLNEGAYGLNVIDKYLLVGNLQGSISFWNSTQGSISVEHPFEVSTKLHEGYIFDILKNGTGPSGFGLITLGLDFNIKLFEVSEQVITEDISTLFFQEEKQFNEGREILSIDLYEERVKLLAGSWNRLITYDLPTQQKVQHLHKSNIYRVRKMKENMIAVANTYYLSFTDPRTPAPVASCAFPQEVRALCTTNDTTVCYGTSEGEIGLIDFRKVHTPLWRDQGTHHSRIYDILKMGDRLVSGDQKGLLVCWSSADGK